MPSSKLDHFHITRVICSALLSGVVLLWTVSWIVTGGGSRPLSNGEPGESILLLIWGALAVPAFGAALHFRSRAATGSGRRTQVERSDEGTGRQAQLFTIVAHALLEGPALLGGVMFLLFGVTLLAWIALSIYGLGTVLTWPQREWFTHR